MSLIRSGNGGGINRIKPEEPALVESVAGEPPNRNPQELLENLQAYEVPVEIPLPSNGFMFPQLLRYVGANDSTRLAADGVVEIGLKKAANDPRWAMVPVATRSFYLHFE